MSCLEVLALGGKKSKDDASENGYWIIRGVLAKSIADAGKFFVERGLTQGFSKKVAPPVARLAISIAERYGVWITGALAAKAVPIVGAASGGAINLLFMQHFQDMAKAHFTIKRLEKKYGTPKIKEEYEKLVI